MKADLVDPVCLAIPVKMVFESLRNRANKSLERIAAICRKLRRMVYLQFLTSNHRCIRVRDNTIDVGYIHILQSKHIDKCLLEFVPIFRACRCKVDKHRPVNFLRRREQSTVG